MNSFEQVVSELMWNQGYWVWTSFKVELSKEEKRRIGRHSTPRWELDIVAYDAPKNVVRVVECKSYFDNPGLGIRWIGDDLPESRAGLLKLFKDDNLREVVFGRLKLQLIAEKRCRPNPTIRLGLACGHTKKSGRDELEKHFDKKGWDLYHEEWLRTELRKVSKGGYDNRVSAVVAKLAYREEAK